MSPRSSRHERKAAASASFSQPLSLLAQSLVTLQSSHRAPNLSSSAVARHGVRFALEGVLELALGIAGVEDLSAGEVLAELAAGDDEEEEPRTESAAVEVQQRLTKLEEADRAQRKDVTERLERMELLLRGQDERRSTSVTASAKAPERPRSRRQECDCEAREGKMDSLDQERRDKLAKETQRREQTFTSGLPPIVKAHRDDLKAATSVAGDRFRKQALKEVKGSLRKHRTVMGSRAPEDAAEEFLAWFCARSHSRVMNVRDSQDGRERERGAYVLDVDGGRTAYGNTPNLARQSAVESLLADQEIKQAWSDHLVAQMEEQELEMMHEVSSALKKEKTAYEARLVSLGWRLEEDSQGLLYRITKV